MLPLAVDLLRSRRTLLIGICAGILAVAVGYLARERARGDEASAWASLARLLFNLDEFSHRN